MTTTSRPTLLRERYHAKAYDFVFVALHHAQQNLGRGDAELGDSDEAHITGPELLEGIRTLALSQFGLLTSTVFRHWGIYSTEDFGRIVFELIETGKMKKTDRDQLSDFFNVYDFEEAFDRGYSFDTRHAFRR